MNHPVSEYSLQRFAEGTSSYAENRSVVLHLLKGCPECAGAVQSYLRPEVPPMAYDRMFERLQRVQQEARLLTFHRPQAPAPRRELRSRASS